MFDTIWMSIVSIISFIGIIMLIIAVISPRMFLRMIRFKMEFGSVIRQSIRILAFFLIIVIALLLLNHT